MPQRNSSLFGTRRRFGAVAVALLGVGLTASCARADHPKPWTPPTYGSAFSKHWQDGNAELASYKLTYPRYGELRTGTAVAVIVTEPFNPDKRVKSDTGGAGTHGVVKLNLVEDFQTGLYDYNLMTSVFVPTTPVNGLPAGSPTKVSFSMQEWCGHIYQQALFSKAQRGTPTSGGGVRMSVNSYFEDVADQQISMDHPAGGIAEEALILWARGLAGPQLEAGESIEVPVLRSMAVQRNRHVGPAWENAKLSRDANPVPVETTQARTFTCDSYRADIGTGATARSYNLLVDQDSGRLIALLRNDGYTLEFVAAERLPYWRLNGNAHEKILKQIGLERREQGEM